MIIGFTDIGLIAFIFDLSQAYKYDCELALAVSIEFDLKFVCLSPLFCFWFCDKGA